MLFPFPQKKGKREAEMGGDQNYGVDNHPNCFRVQQHASLRRVLEGPELDTNFAPPESNVP